MSAEASSWGITFPPSEGTCLQGCMSVSPSSEVSQSSLLHAQYPPRCLTGLLAAAPGRRHFTEGPEATGGHGRQWGGQLWGLPFSWTQPRTRQCLTEPHRGDGGLQSLFWAGRRLTLRTWALGAAFSLGTPPGRTRLPEGFWEADPSVGRTFVKSCLFRF